MLTFILLVVLGGGVGLLAVSLAESGKPATVAGPKRRGAPATTESEAGDTADPEPGIDPVPAHDPEPVSVVPEPAVGEDHPPAAPVPVPPVPPMVEDAPGPGPREAGEPAAVLSPPRPRRTRPEDVPRAFTAIEGRYADVARVPLWRRGLAVVGVVAITVAGGVLVAVVLAAAFGAAAEVLDKTIG